MQRSSAAILQSGNLFMFTMHNPVMFTDPSGMVAMPMVMMHGMGLAPGIGNGIAAAVVRAAWTAGLSDTPIVPFCPDGGIDASSVKKSLKIKNQILQKRMQNRMNNSSGSNSSNTGSTSTANTGQARAGGVAGNTSNVIRATTSSNMSRFSSRVQQAQTQTGTNAGGRAVNMTPMTPAEAARIVQNATRVGTAATHNDIYHRAGSFLTESQLASGHTSIMTGQIDGVARTMLSVPGIVNNKSGIFEFIIEPDGTVSHQLFRPH